MLRAFLEEEEAERCASLRMVLVGGEALTPDLESLFFIRLRHPELRNQYGPTETTIDSTHWLCQPGSVERVSVPIGRPVDNTSLYLLSPDGLPVPLSAVGEVAVGGAGLARGYLGRPDLTAERFLPDLIGLPGARLYRTGDLGRYRPDGALELIGRADFQVKIRGYRVEPEEVEAALRALPGVGKAAVVVQGEAAGRRLLACVIPEAGELLDTASLREELRRHLPDYMVPAAWVVLPDLPLSPNGKVDRQALARLESQAPVVGAVSAPRTPAEEVVAAIWADVLALDRVGPEDDFFALGGHSLIATRVISRVRDAFGIDLPLRTLFEEPTVTGFAAVVEQAARGAASPPAPPITRVPRTTDLPLSFAQQRLWFLAQFEPLSPVYNVPTALRLSGDLDRAVLAASLGEIVARHEALRTTF
jgi:acyl carrier protein